MIPDWTAFPVGIVIAGLATMVGLGGGILWTPYLILVMGLVPSEAVMTSLVVQVVGMSSGAIAALWRKGADARSAAALVPAALPGVAVGVWLSRIIEPDSLVFLLGCSCMATALLFVWMEEPYEFTPARRLEFPRLLPYLPIASVFSVLTGLLSVGAGDFLVPVLRNRLGLSMQVAIGTCLVVMAINAVFAAILHASAQQQWHPELILWAVGGVLIGGQIGPRVADRVPDQTLKEVFIYGLSLVGIHILFNA